MALGELPASREPRERPRLCHVQYLRFRGRPANRGPFPIEVHVRVWGGPSASTVRSRLTVMTTPRRERSPPRRERSPRRRPPAGPASSTPRVDEPIVSDPLDDPTGMLAVHIVLPVEMAEHFDSLGRFLSHYGTNVAGDGDNPTWYPETGALHAKLLARASALWHVAGPRPTTWCIERLSPRYVDMGLYMHDLAQATRAVNQRRRGPRP